MNATTNNQNPHVLKPWEEARGKVQNLEIENNSVFLKFTGGTRINLIMPSEEVVERLMGSIGKQVNILRTDVVGKEYLVKIDGGSQSSYFIIEGGEQEK